MEKVFYTMSTTQGFDALDDDQLALLEDRLREARVLRTPRPAPAVPLRARALDTLEFLGIPTTPKVVAAVAEARTGVALDSRALASVRRDEQAAWRRDRDAGRPPAPRLAPGLHHEGIEPVRALLTVTSWDLPRRMVTPLSPRADHPALVLTLLAEADRLEAVDNDAAERVARLAARYAVGIPGAAPFASGPDARDALGRAATQEHARFAEDAATERAQAARRARIVDDTARVWGRSATTTTSEGAGRTRHRRSGA
jgi:hypothetical protein